MRAVFVIVWLVAVALPAAVPAAPAPGVRMSEPILVLSGGTEIQREFEARFIAQRWNALGLSSSDVQARLDGLSDEEVHQLAGNLRGTATAVTAFPLFIGLMAIIGLAAVSGWLYRRTI